MKKNYIKLLIIPVIILQGCANQLISPNEEQTIISKIPVQYYINETNKETPIKSDVEKFKDLNTWWEQFKDPTLNQIIHSAQENNANISSAKLNLKNYETQIISSRAKNIPNLNAVGSAARGNSQTPPAPATTTLGIGLQTSWELDLFGINNLDTKAKELQKEGASAQWHDAQIVVAAETARSYFNYYYCRNAVDIFEKDYEGRSKQHEITKINVKVGLEEESSLFLSEAALSQAKNNVVAKGAQCQAEFKALVALSGEEDTKLDSQLKENTYAQIIDRLNKSTISEPQSVPADLLKQRPDIFNAYKNIQAQAINVAIAMGQNYPKITFSGSLSFNKIMTENIALSGSVWSIGPLNIVLPIFDAGVRKANYSLALEQYQQSKIQFASLIRNAIKEIETSYINLNAIEQQMVLNENSVSGFSKSLKASETRYTVGLSSLYELEDSRRSYLNSLNNSVSNQRERLNALIDMYKALGGGWNSI